MKKVLALIVAFALCFTAFAGCFATSAAAPLSFTIKGSIADDNGAATVTVSGSYEIRTAQLLTVTLDSKLKFEGVENGINIDEVDHVTDETPENLYSVEGNVIKFLDDYTGNFEIVINVTAPANDGATDATYTVTASADIAGWDDTEVSSVDPVTDVVTVKAAVPEHTCDFSGDPVIVQPTKDTEGSKTYTCTCGLTHVETIPVPTQINAMIQHNLTLKDRVYDRFVFSVKQISNAGFDAVSNGYFVTIDYTKYKATDSGYFVNPDDSGITLYDADKDVENSQGNGRSFFFNKLALYEMTSDYTITIYVKDANGIVVAYITDTTSIAEQALALVDGKDPTTSKKLFTCLADMMNYGQAAQDYFKRAGDDLSDAASPVEIFADHMSHASDASSLPDTLPAEAAGLKKELSTTAFNANGNVKIASSTIPTFMVIAGTYDPANTTIEVSYTNGYGNLKEATVAVEPTKNSSGKWRYDFEFDQLAMYDLSSTVTVTMKYNGQTEATYEYALTSYINSKMSQANLTSILTAMSLFSRSASLQLGLTAAY